ncbi:O-antigen ligase family protein [Pasteurella sp. PK-2025]|uniref:O-antigen ligase family protein n=1 Tax=unclassified Pasteurella TaxID=2621516 RepID=UPI003C75E991
MKSKIKQHKYFFLSFIGLVLLRTMSAMGADLSFLILAVIALYGGKYLIFSYLLSWLFTLFNPVIGPEGNYAALLRYVIILFGFTHIIFYMLLNKIVTVPKYLVWFFLLTICILIHSIMISYEPAISILKLLSWGIAAFTLLSTWIFMPNEEREQTYHLLILLLKTLILISLPFLFIPEIGYAKNGTGFQGLLNHPQAFGPTIALLGSIMIGNILSSKKLNLSNLVWFGICAVLVILSEARTAGLALILALTLSILLKPLFTGKNFVDANPIFKNKYFYLWLFIILAALATSYPLYIDSIESYIFKRTHSTSLTDLADASRGALVQDMLRNITENPFLGIGFGVASNPNHLDVVRDPIFNLPISAVIEKGVLPIAIIEELGLIIGTFVFLWFLYSFRQAAKSDVQKLTTALCIFCLNLGENMFFSIGGMGMLMLIFFTRSVIQQGIGK